MNDYIIRKANELAYAIIRVSAYIQRNDLRQRLEVNAFNLIEYVAYQNYPYIRLALNALKSYLEIGRDIYEVEPVNSGLIIKEIEFLGTEVAKISGSNAKLDLLHYFSKNPEIENPEATVVQDKTENRLTGKNLRESSKRKDWLKIILNKISGFPDKRFTIKDLTSAFPEISDRTIRYNLKELQDSGVIEAVGDGPTRFYILKNISETILLPSAQKLSNIDNITENLSDNDLGGMPETSVINP